MRPTACSVAVLGGLLALLLFPGLVAAHDITNVEVDCAEESILVSGESFGGADGVAVKITVSGPKGYVQKFVADPHVPWTVALPLGPSGTYKIRWSDPDAGSATFAVDCPDESLPPVTPKPSPSEPPVTAKPSPSEPPVTPKPSPSQPDVTPSPSPSQPDVTPSPSPSQPDVTPSPSPSQHTAKPSKTPGHAGPTPDGTLPPTDTRAPSWAVARNDTVLASLFFLAVFSIAVVLRRTAVGRPRRR